MKASDFLKKYEREQGKLEQDEEEHSLQAHAKERAKHPGHLNAGTPYDWEDLEAYRKELERLDKEGPGGSTGDPKKG
ncbi:peptidase S14 [Marinimicrobium locisalis]|uniref:peptidase S14 n=1 Tax=Marinimicrobium locisalis TaxID=546022 RepID=UPI0032217479